MYHSAIKHLLRIDTVPYVLFCSVAIFIVYILFVTIYYVQIRTRKVKVRLCHITGGTIAFFILSGLCIHNIQALDFDNWHPQECKYTSVI